MHSCTHWLRPRNPPHPTPRIRAHHIRGCYRSAKVDDISLWPPDCNSLSLFLLFSLRQITTCLCLLISWTVWKGQEHVGFFKLINLKRSCSHKHVWCKLFDSQIEPKRQNSTKRQQYYKSLVLFPRWPIGRFRMTNLGEDWPEDSQQSRRSWWPTTWPVGETCSKRV